MATNFVLYRTCSLGAKVSQDLLDRFSQFLHNMVGIELQMNDTSSCFRYFKGPCQEWGKITYPLHLSLCRSETEWHIAIANMHINSCTNCSTSCEKMVKIVSVFLVKVGKKMKIVL